MAFKMAGFSAFTKKDDIFGKSKTEKNKEKNIVEEAFAKFEEADDAQSHFLNNVLADDPNNAELKVQHNILQSKADNAEKEYKKLQEKYNIPANIIKKK